MNPRLAAAVVAIALTAAALSGCSAPAASPSPTAAFASEEEAFAAAEATYRAYVDALNNVDLSDPATFEDVYAWTTGDLNASDRRGLSEYHADNVEVIGDSRIALVAPGSGDLDNDVLELSVCLDVTDVQVLDSDGDSLVDDGRADVQSLTVGLIKSAVSPTSLLIESIGPRDSQPQCA